MQGKIITYHILLWHVLHMVGLSANPVDTGNWYCMLCQIYLCVWLPLRNSVGLGSWFLYRCVPGSQNTCNLSPTNSKIFYQPAVFCNYWEVICSRLTKAKISLLATKFIWSLVAPTCLPILWFGLVTSCSWKAQKCNKAQFCVYLYGARLAVSTCFWSLCYAKLNNCQR